ncbi:hypothetical protein KR093_010480 [Drosophila rubida]|uniref:N-acetylgalactosaminide beta-1,3-galactosyltransferase n=1 Tax=Drosophila rubida TaxID=30044 RepID=A0AAD4PP87_9MUSC|nr:hypothetical protein KR093_010480 [Drosophila rubida]
MKIFRPQSKANSNWEMLLMLFIGLICGACLSKLLQRARKSSEQASYTPHAPTADYTSLPSASTAIAKSRILCMVVTSSVESRQLLIHRTWGSRCHMLLFLGDSNSTFRERHSNSWTKSRIHLQYVYQQFYEQFDWFLKVPDDTYVVMENLQHLLADYTPETPIYFGSNDRQQGFVSGAAGYVFSREALHRFISLAHGDGNRCSNRSYGIEHVELSRCLRNVGVVAGDSRDEDGLPRFLPTPPFKSSGLLSNSAISFHYSNVADFHMLDFVIYRVHPFGIGPIPNQRQLLVMPQKGFITGTNTNQPH